MQLKHTHTKICALYGEGAVTHRTRPKWFANFCARDFSLEDAPQSGKVDYLKGMESISRSGVSDSL